MMEAKLEMNDIISNLLFMKNTVVAEPPPAIANARRSSRISTKAKTNATNVLLASRRRTELRLRLNDNELSAEEDEESSLPRQVTRKRLQASKTTGPAAKKLKPNRDVLTKKSDAQGKGKTSSSVDFPMEDNLCEMGEKYNKKEKSEKKFSQAKKSTKGKKVSKASSSSEDAKVSNSKTFRSSRSRSSSTRLDTSEVASTAIQAMTSLFEDGRQDSERTHSDTENDDKDDEAMSDGDGDGGNNDGMAEPRRKKSGPAFSISVVPEELIRQQTDVNTILTYTF